MQALAEQSRIVRLPLNRVGSLTKVSKTFAELEQKFQREPSTEEVADAIGITVEEIRDSLRIAGRHVSVDAPFSQGEEGSLLDVLSDINESNPESTMMAESLIQEVQRSLATLTTREAEVIGLYFGLNQQQSMTLEEIGDKFNLTRERVRQIKEKATRRLRHTSRNRTLKSYLGS